MKMVSRLLTDGEIRELLNETRRERQTFKGFYRLLFPIIIIVLLFLSFIFIYINQTNWAAVSGTAMVILIIILRTLNLFSWFPKTSESQKEWDFYQKSYFVYETKIDTAIMAKNENAIPYWIGKTGDGGYIMIFGQCVRNFKNKLDKSNIRLIQDDDKKLVNVKSWGRNIQTNMSDEEKLGDLCERLSIRHGFTEVLEIARKRKTLFKKFI
jgi:hypothetical protein